MALRLEIVSRHRQSLGERGVKEFGIDGGTIGRSLESDWVLPDAQRYLSSRHASIDFRSGSYYIVDTSMNGVFVNDAKRPVGRGKPQRLFSGDRLRIGEYEMSVHIDEVDNTAETLAGGHHIDPVDLAQRVPPPEPMTHDLIDPYEVTGVGFEELMTEGDDNVRTLPHGEIELRLEEEEVHAAPVERTAPPPVSAAAHLARRAKETPRAATPPKHAAAPGPATTITERPKPAAPVERDPAPVDAGVLDAFFRGAGIPAQPLTDQQAAQTLLRLGQLMRELIVGITESLQVRAEQRNALRLPNTTIQPRGNNPLKFSAGIEEALHNLFFRQSEEYLSSVEAVREALRDIKTHQQVMLAALPLAVADYIGRLDPDELENKFSGSTKRGALLNAANKFRYWDLYKDLYQVVAQHTAGQLPAQFVEELSRAYEQQSSRIAGPPAKAQGGRNARTG